MAKNDAVAHNPSLKVRDGQHLVIHSSDKDVQASIIPYTTRTFLFALFIFLVYDWNRTGKGLEQDWNKAGTGLQLD